MARQEIILGTPPQGLGGDPPRTASMKINAMTEEIYQNLGKLIPVNSNVDGTLGRIPLVGSFGLGGPAINQVPGTNANTTTLPSGRYYSDSWVGTPSASGYLDIQRNFSTGFAVQLWESLESGQLASRSQYSGVWQDWLVTYNQKSAILDPANGGLMSYGSNANGEYWKYANGQLVCKFRRTSTIAINVSTTGMYIGTPPGWVFPVPFVGDPPMVDFQSTSSLGYVLFRGPVTADNNNATLYVSAMISIPSGGVTITMMAVGRWK